jgi:hypothetical protein
MHGLWRLHGRRGQRRYCRGSRSNDWTVLLTRVSGDGHTIAAYLDDPTGSAPRGRGWQPDALPRHAPARFSPAWAGMAPTDARASRAPPVQPRVGGDGMPPPLPPPRVGSAPCGRGWLHRPHVRRGQLRFSPTWAGMALPYIYFHNGGLSKRRRVGGWSWRCFNVGLGHGCAPWRSRKRRRDLSWIVGGAGPWRRLSIGAPQGGLEPFWSAWSVEGHEEQMHGCRHFWEWISH